MVSGRRRLFEAKLKDRKFVFEYLNAKEVNDDKVDWYSLEQLQELKADFIAVDSFYYKRFLGTEKGKLYPSIRLFFIDLLAENIPTGLFSTASPSPTHGGSIPAKINTVEKNRIVILAKRS